MPSPLCTPCRWCSPRQNTFCTQLLRCRLFSFQTLQPLTLSFTWQMVRSHTLPTFPLQMTRQLPLPAFKNYHALVNDSHIFATFSSQLVYWQTENQACVRFLQMGSRQPYIQSLVLDIKKKERDLNIAIIPVWTPCDHLRIADAGSRFATSTDEWFIDRASLAAVFQHFSFFPEPVSRPQQTPSLRCSLLSPSKILLV